MVLRAAKKSTFALLLLIGPVLTISAMGSGQWEVVAPGLDLGSFSANKPSLIGNSLITILRIDPAFFDLETVCLSQTEESVGQTAKQWRKKYDLTAVINAGMFGTDGQTHVGYLKSGDYVNNGHVNDYQSVAAFDPIDKRASVPFRVFDLDDPNVTMDGILADYKSAVQNLRLIKRPGENRWHQKGKRWSEAALGEDTQGRILFIFCRSPFSMSDLNRELLTLGIDLVTAQHLEGGPEAQMYIRHGDQEVEMFGSFETGFFDNDRNSRPWRIPNVLGIRPRSEIK